ncbi:unnamed protein product [Dicrocoelium dendriticum]|nr:unnamed protein product [Dicrocoelium dendriticum]
MLYDATACTWVPSGPGLGVSKVQLYHNSATNAYRVVGWRLQDREVVINCAIVCGLKYHRARQTFHQWRDAKQQVYGLNFTSADEADEFAAAVERALERLAEVHKEKVQQQLQQQQQQQPQAQSHASQPIPQPQQLFPHQSSAPVINRPMQECVPDYDVSNSNRASSQDPQSTRMVTGTYVDLNNAVLPHAAGQPSSPVHLHPQTPVTAEYAYPGQTSGDAPRQNDEKYGTSSAVATGTVFNGNGHIQSDPRCYSSSDDSVKSLSRAVGMLNCAAGPSIRSSDGAASPCPSSGSGRANSISSAPATVVPPPPPPPPPPPLPSSSGSARLSRPLYRSTTNAPSVSDTGDDDGEEDGSNPDSGFASQLRMAKQHRMRAASLAAVNSDHSSGSATVGRAAGFDMISDLQRVLAARRRAKEAEENGTIENGAIENGGGGDIPSSQSSTLANPRCLGSMPAQHQPVSSASGSIVPGFATLRKNSSPALDSNTCGLFPNSSTQPTFGGNASTTNGASAMALVSRADLEVFKRELMSEFRREVQQLKNDVIEALRASVNRC